jgi:hypothetical protein
MNDHSKRQQIIKAILEFWERPNTSFKSDELVRSVMLDVGTFKMYPDTVLRYLRHLKNDGLLDYICPCRKSRIYLKIKK